jgi:hypothetical protein
MNDTVNKELLNENTRRDASQREGSLAYLMLVCLVAALGGLLRGN